MKKALVGFALAALCAAGQTVKQGNAARTSPASGEEMYRSYCAACHGKAGKGDGPAAAALKKMPTDLTTLAKSSGGKYPALRVRSAIVGDVGVPAHGSSEMPVWGQVFPKMGDGSQVALRISNLVDYLEKLQAR